MVMAFIKLFIVSLISVFGIVNMSPVNTRSIDSGKNELKNLFYVSDQEERLMERNSVNNAVVEKVKARILDGLHLKEPPKPFQPIPPLLHFMPQNNSWSGLYKNKTVSRDGRSEFFLSELVPNTCFDQKFVRCVRFQINLESLKRDGKTAELWLFKKEGIKQFMISQLEKDSSIKYQFTVSNLSKMAKWIRLDATVLLNSDILDLEVSSLNVPIDIGRDKNPILIVKDYSLERTKRSARLCENDTTHCCVKEYQIFFKDIGWDSWIIEPSSYKANICKGSCENRIDLAENNHSNIMITMISKGKKKVPEIKESIHCSPKEFKSLRIIYIAESGLKVITNLPNMAVTDCACR